jgi:hypothetical protein
VSVVGSTGTRDGRRLFVDVSRSRRWLADQPRDALHLPGRVADPSRRCGFATRATWMRPLYRAPGPLRRSSIPLGRPPPPRRPRRMVIDRTSFSCIVLYLEGSFHGNCVAQSRHLTWQAGEWTRETAGESVLCGGKNPPEFRHVLHICREISFDHSDHCQYPPGR